MQPVSYGLGAAALGLGRGEGTQVDKMRMDISAQDRMLLERVTRESPSGGPKRGGMDEGCSRAVQGRHDPEIEIHRIDR